MAETLGEVYDKILDFAEKNGSNGRFFRHKIVTIGGVEFHIQRPLDRMLVSYNNGDGTHTTIDISGESKISKSTYSCEYGNHCPKESSFACYKESNTAIEDNPIIEDLEILLGIELTKNNIVQENKTMITKISDELETHTISRVV